MPRCSITKSDFFIIFSKLSISGKYDSKTCVEAEKHKNVAKKNWVTSLLESLL